MASPFVAEALPLAAEDAWEAEITSEWVHTTVAELPFLHFHEFTSLRQVGAALLQMPLSPFFTLFLAKGSAHAAAFNAQRGATGYEETEWRADRMHEGRVRRVRYEATIEPNDEEQPRRARCIEQRLALRLTSLGSVS